MTWDTYLNQIRSSIHLGIMPYIYISKNIDSLPDTLFQDFLDLLIRTGKLNIVYMGCLDISQSRLGSLFNAFSWCEIQELTISKLFIANENNSSIINFFSNFSQCIIRKLELDSCELEFQHYVPIAKSLETSQLEIFSIQKQKIDDNSATTLASVLAHQQTIIELCLEKCVMSLSAFDVLTRSLPPKLVSLDLSNIQTGKYQYNEWPESDCPDNKALTQLVMMEADINSLHIRLIRKCPALEKLDIDEARISRKNLIALASSLSITLETLKIAGVNIPNNIAYIVGKHIGALPNLHTLDITRCGLDTLTVEEFLLEILEIAKKLEVLILSINRFESISPRLLESLKKSSLTSLDLSNNKIKKENVLFLITLLHENDTLSMLDIMSDSFDFSDPVLFAALAEALQRNSSLQTLRASCGARQKQDKMDGVFEKDTMRRLGENFSLTEFQPSSYHMNSFANFIHQICHRNSKMSYYLKCKAMAGSIMFSPYGFFKNPLFERRTLSMIHDYFSDPEITERSPLKPK